jgi:hypothetical protein
MEVGEEKSVAVEVFKKRSSTNPKRLERKAQVLNRAFRLPHDNQLQMIKFRVWDTCKIQNGSLLK